MSIHNDSGSSKEPPRLGVLSNSTSSPWDGIDDYEAESSFYETPMAKRKKPPIKDRPADTNNPIAQKLIQRMIYENFMADEPDINVRLEAYKRKLTK